jgi:hypothetical protein
MKPGPTPRGERRGHTSCCHKIFLMLEFEYSVTIRMWRLGVLVRIFHTMLIACSMFCNWCERRAQYVMKCFPYNRTALLPSSKISTGRCMLRRYKVNRSKGPQGDPHNILGHSLGGLVIKQVRSFRWLKTPLIAL